MWKLGRLPVVLGILCGAAALTACGGEGAPGANGVGASAISYFADIKPIMDTHCVSCHQPGEIGTGDLSNYASVSAQASLILQQVESGLMPPWFAGEGCNEYQHNPSLSAAQKTLLRSWNEAGAPKGAPADDPGAQKQQLPELANISHTIGLATPYLPNKELSDDYRCFVVDWPDTEDSYVTGFGVRADNTSTVHHLIAYVAEPGAAADQVMALDAADPGQGYSCYGGPSTEMDGRTSFFGAWAPGVMDSPAPKGTGILVKPGSKVVLQMHYNLVGWNGETDQSSVVVSTASSVEKEAKFQFWTNPSWVNGGTMDIPAGDPDVEHSWAMDPTGFVSGGKPFTIYNAGLHMHTRGKSAQLSVLRSEGAEECVLNVPRYDFDWQFGYQLQTPMRFQPGDKLRLECHFDNSPANQPSVGGNKMAPTNLNWGEGTNDEMCLGIVYIAPD